MRPTFAGRFLFLATAAFFLVAAGLPAAAQAPAEANFDQWHTQLLRAAEAAAAEASAARLVETGAVAPPTEEPNPAPNSKPFWLRQLSPEAWRLLRETFAAENVPMDLVSVGWVESRFQADALSPKGARGLWQLMPATARRYGLTVSRERDDRIDLPASTRVAARHLADLHRQFGDWLLALAAYNAGAPRVEAAMARAGSRNFWQLRPWLPAETQSYVPAVLAAIGSRAGLARGNASQSPSPAGERIVFAGTIVGEPPRAPAEATNLAVANGIL